MRRRDFVILAGGAATTAALPLPRARSRQRRLCSAF
jgi:NaMN:DMB phosphoribosyltransferase